MILLELTAELFELILYVTWEAHNAVPTRFFEEKSHIIVLFYIVDIKVVWFVNCIASIGNGIFIIGEKHKLMLL